MTSGNWTGFSLWLCFARVWFRKVTAGCSCSHVSFLVTLSVPFLSISVFSVLFHMTLSCVSFLSSYVTYFTFNFAVHLFLISLFSLVSIFYFLLLFFSFFSFVPFFPLFSLCPWNNDDTVCLSWFGAVSCFHIWTVCSHLQWSEFV
jgi:hypothetical protein